MGCFRGQIHAGVVVAAGLGDGVYKEWYVGAGRLRTLRTCTPHLEFAVRVQEDIGRLDVPVDHLGAVHELQGTQHLQQHAQASRSHTSAASFITTCLREHHDTVQQRRQQAITATALD